MIIPTACHSWEFGQGNGKRLLSKQEITEEVSGLNLCYHSSGLGLEDRRRFLRKKTQTNMSLRTGLWGLSS